MSTPTFHPRVLTDVEADRIKAAHPGIPNPDFGGCITCGGTGTYTWPAEQVNACACRQQYGLYFYFLHANIGLRYQRLTWQDTEQVNSTALMAALEYADNAEANVRAGL